jgi:hypothetical protein
MIRESRGSVVPVALRGGAAGRLSSAGCFAWQTTGRFYAIPPLTEMICAVM